MPASAHPQLDASSLPSPTASCDESEMWYKALPVLQHKVEADVEPQVLAPSQPGAMTEAHKRPQAESRQLEEPLAA